MQPTSNRALGRTVSNLQKKVTKMQEQLNQKQDKKITISLSLERSLSHLMTESEARELLKRMPFLSLPNKVA